MPRIRADDYDDKKNAILDAAATLFAEFGYTGAKMEDIAERCGVSKSMLYHYFKKKEDVLFELLQQHVLSMIAALEEYAEQAGSDKPDELLRGMIEVYLEPTKAARARHVVALHDMRYLTEEQKKKQTVIERDLLKLLEVILSKVRPDRDRQEYRVYALLLVGMLNWIELWYRRSGRVSPSELYSRVSALFLHGYMSPS